MQQKYLKGRKMSKRPIPPISRPGYNSEDAAKLLRGEIAFITRNTRDKANTLGAFIRRWSKKGNLNLSPIIRKEGEDYNVYIKEQS